MYTGENRVMLRQGKPEQKYDGAFGAIFRINNCFQRSRQ